MIFLAKEVDVPVLKHFLKCQFQLYLGQNKSERQNCGNEFFCFGKDTTEHFDFLYQSDFV